jgi:hypothetical protein
MVISQGAIFHFQFVVLAEQSLGDFHDGDQVPGRRPLLNVRRKVLPVFPAEFDFDFVHIFLFDLPSAYWAFL